MSDQIAPEYRSFDEPFSFPLFDAKFRFDARRGVVVGSAYGDDDRDQLNINYKGNHKLQLLIELGRF